MSRRQLALTAVLMSAVFSPAAAQIPDARGPTLVEQDGVDLWLGGLLRAGLEIQPDEADRNSGFTIFDAQAGLGGGIGLLFDYFVRAELDVDDVTFRLLDARLDVEIAGPEVAIGVGLTRTPFGLEALADEREFTFVNRAQASEAIAPGRQLGAELFGAALEGRLTYGAGVFNGNGRTLENDDGKFMYAARAQFNSIGPIEFYDDLVLQFGASIAYSEDTAAELGPGLVTPPPDSVAPTGGAAGFEALADGFSGKRLLWGLDAYGSYRDFTIVGEYLSGDFEPVIDEPVGEKRRAYGGYVQAGYRAWGALEGVIRYDGFHPLAGANRDYLVFGINLFPYLYTKIGAQFAVALHDSPPSPTIAGNQFILTAQVDF